MVAFHAYEIANELRPPLGTSFGKPAGEFGTVLPVLDWFGVGSKQVESKAYSAVPIGVVTPQDRASPVRTRGRATFARTLCEDVPLPDPSRSERDVYGIGTDLQRAPRCRFRTA
jgi:hypothetical protein